MNSYISVSLSLRSPKDEAGVPTTKLQCLV